MSFVTSLKILFEYFLSVFIWSFLNPFGLVQTLRQTVGQYIAISRSVVKGVMYDDTVTFVLPFRRNLESCEWWYSQTNIPFVGYRRTKVCL